MSLLTSPQASANGQPLDAPPQATGLYDIESRLDDGRVARYTLSLPHDYAPEHAHPLVVVLHYAGQPTRFYGRPLVEELFAPAWQELGAIFVAPESLDGQWTSATNETFVLQLVAAVQAAYAIDPRRIVVAGYSMGAIGSWHFATHYPEVFSAAVPIAGFPRSEIECNTPVYALATEADEIFDYARFRQAIADLKARGCEVEFATAPARGHYDVNGFGTALRAVAPWLTRIWPPRSTKEARR